MIKAANLTINVRDMDRSIAFYTSIGFAVNERWGAHYAKLTAPGIVIGLHPTGSSNLNGGSGNVSIGFTTDDLEGTRTALQDLSIAVTDRKEEGGRFVHFTDPDGTALYFIEPKW